MNKENLTTAGVLASVIFFGLKTYAGLVSGSIAIISDAINSFLDVFSYSIIKVSVRMQAKAPDKTHPFGHYRAEPLASFIISLVAFMLGGNIVKDAIVSLFIPKPIIFSKFPLLVLGLAVMVKVILTFLFNTEGKKTDSPALKAAAVDSRNDVFTSLTALIGFYSSNFWDNLAALFIGLWILFSAFKLGMSNIGYLIGAAPNEAFLQEVKRLALGIPQVMGVNDIRAHFVGTYLHMEIHIEVEPQLCIQKAHDIGDNVRQKLLELKDVDTVFVHIDVWGGKSINT